MFRKCLSLVLVTLFVCALSNQAARAAQNNQQGMSVEAAKQRVGKIGVGDQARVKIKLRNGTEVKGYIYRVEDDNFIVADLKSGIQTTISYSDVADVKRKRRHTTLKTVGITLGVLYLVGVVANAAYD